MSRIEMIDAANWKEFIGSDLSVLMLAKTTCDNCARWTEELDKHCADQSFLPGVRFGKLCLDQRGLIAFKKANPWIAEIDVLPFNVIYVKGERVKTFAGAGVDRLRNRIDRLMAP